MKEHLGDELLAFLFLQRTQIGFVPGMVWLSPADITFSSDVLVSPLLTEMYSRTFSGFAALEIACRRDTFYIWSITISLWEGEGTDGQMVYGGLLLYIYDIFTMVFLITFSSWNTLHPVFVSRSFSSDTGRSFFSAVFRHDCIRLQITIHAFGPSYNPPMPSFSFLKLCL